MHRFRPQFPRSVLFILCAALLLSSFGTQGTRATNDPSSSKNFTLSFHRSRLSAESVVYEKPGQSLRIDLTPQHELLPRTVNSFNLLARATADDELVTAAGGDIVFSQVYSQGGQPGSTYQNNFVELFNRSNTPIDINGWRIHIASGNGLFNIAIGFTSSRGLLIQPGQYLLIMFGGSSSNGAPLPFPDLFVPNSFFDNIPTSGKLALAPPNSGFPPSICPLPHASIKDFIAYGGTITCFEGSGPVGDLSTTTAAIRKSGGCTDTDNNAGDFSISTPTPRNSSAPKNVCSSNPIDQPEFFVRQHYLDFLNRQPDDAGLAFWVGEITSCGSDAQCIEVKRINVSAAFFLSIEFQETGYLAYRTYKTSYGNMPGTPVPLTFNEFLQDTVQLGQNVIVGQAGWEQQLESNKVAYFNDFVSRLRFTNAYPAGMTPAQFVDALLTNAGFTPSDSDRDAAIGEFGSSPTADEAAARARALRRVAENSTLASLERNRAFVLMQYFGYLRRNPNDPPEPGLNFDGYNFWLNKLNQFNGDYIAAEMVKAFISSTEYRQRFAQ